jgi:subtilisin family serine protease
MNRLAALILVVASAVCAAATASAQSGTGGGPGPQFILRAPSPLIDAVCSRHGLVITAVLRDDVVERLVEVTGPSGVSAEAILEEVGDDDDVVDFEVDRGVRVPEVAAAPALNQSTAAILEGLPTRVAVNFFGTPSISTYVSQPASTLIRLSATQPLATGAGVVAIIDTGVDATHPLLRNVVLPGFDFTRDMAGTATDLIDLPQSTAAILEQSTAAILEQRTVVALNQSTAAILEQSTAAILEGQPPLPGSFGHGTMIAGLVHLVAPTAQILPLKAFRADGTANVSNIIRAIYYAADSGARVINMSFSMMQPSSELTKAIDYATSRGAVCVAAAGNQGKEMIVYPAGFRNVIGVASTTNADKRSAFSNYGDALVTLAAPGESLITSFPGGRYAGVAGTSFSTAFVTATISLMAQVWPDLTVRQAFDDLSRATRLSGQSLGYGRLDVYGTVTKTLQRH